MKKTILIVDDNHNNLQLAGSVLSPFYKLMLADSGEKALRAVEQKVPDIILLDVMMPGMTGLDVCRQLKDNEKYKDIPIIFLTAKTEEDDIEAGFDIGGADYVSKPFKVKELLVRIRTQLELQSAKEALKERNIELENMVTSRDRFFSIISHDLRSPLGALMGLTDLLCNGSDSYDKDELTEHIKMMHSSIVNIYGLVEDLLLWSRTQRKALEYNPEMLPLGRITNDIIEGLSLKASQKSIQLKNLIEKQQTAFTDHYIFSTIMRNLISNAIKFTRREGEIVISTIEKGNGYLEVSVTD
ncbi:MAG: hybrid sensor histidine kinase/response regulator, partial [Ignavibacteria bacterium]|nr:hybrid sensor histidine kinase/response regulator [Ignavibacteria bacterium]